MLDDGVVRNPEQPRQHAGRIRPDAFVGGQTRREHVTADVFGKGTIASLRQAEPENRVAVAEVDLLEGQGTIRRPDQMISP